ncbi:MAG: uracil-DNA glycosylase [Clostridium sp.]|nr:uracil-DNA glycosylase [Clostridium sp.]
MYGWERLIQACNECKKCGLARTRKNVVIGAGNINASMMIVGEGPGEQEDIQGIPFVGAAGKLLDLLFGAMRITKDQYYISNIVKCRPPNNRVPTEKEAFACLPYLRNQLVLIKPKIIVCMGATAAKYIVDKNAKITKIRGRWIERKGYWIMPTFHPAALLRDESKKIPMWEDFKRIKQRLDNICPNQRN